MKKEIEWIIKDKYNGKVDAGSLRQDINRLKSGEPIDYIIGWKDFLGVKIFLEQHPLIPREESAYWAERAMATMIAEGKAMKGGLILDIFAGSGCLGLSVLKHIPQIKVHFADKEKKFLKQIEENAKANKINKRRYRLISSDIFSKIKDKYDVILANPPYIPSAKLKKMPKSVITFEPIKALDGGKDGLFFIKRFLKGAKKRLKKEGAIYMEFNSGQEQKIGKILKENKYPFWIFGKDQFGKYRYVVVKNQ